MKLKVYLETSVVSYLVARRNRDIIVAAHQELTRQWWEQERNNYHLTVSEVVRRAIDAVCVNSGYRPTILCTPEELTEELEK